MAGVKKQPNPNAPQVGATTAWWLYLDPAGNKAAAPPVPKPIVLGVAGRTWWNWAWKTPQSTQWDASHRMTVARRAWMEDMMLSNPQVTLLTQIRQWDDTLGLTPRGMVGLHWQIGYPPAEDSGNPLGEVKIA